MIPDYLSKNKTIIFGPYVSNDTSVEDLQIVSLADIRKAECSLSADLMEPITQAGTLFTQILN